MKSPVYVINPFPFVSPIYLSTHPGPSQIFIILLFNGGRGEGRGTEFCVELIKSHSLPQIPPCTGTIYSFLRRRQKNWMQFMCFERDPNVIRQRLKFTEK